MSVVVDISSNKYKSLHPFSLESFRSCEKTVVCDFFPDGILPGMEKDGEDLQSGNVENFHNFAHYVSIIETETKVVNGRRYLTTDYFYNRARAWSSTDITIKKGKVVGYYVDGLIFALDKWDKMVNYLFLNFYLDIMGSNEKLEELKRKQERGLLIKVTDSGHYQDDVFIKEFLKIFPKILAKYEIDQSP